MFRYPIYMESVDKSLLSASTMIIFLPPCVPFRTSFIVLCNNATIQSVGQAEEYQDHYLTLYTSLQCSAWQRSAGKCSVELSNT